MDEAEKTLRELEVELDLCLAALPRIRDLVKTLEEQPRRSVVVPLAPDRTDCEDDGRLFRSRLHDESYLFFPDREEDVEPPLWFPAAFLAVGSGGFAFSQMYPKLMKTGWGILACEAFGIGFGIGLLALWLARRSAWSLLKRAAVGLFRWFFPKTSEYGCYQPAYLGSGFFLIGLFVFPACLGLGAAFIGGGFLFQVIGHVALHYERKLG